MRIATIALGLLLALPAAALEPREGWEVHPTSHDYRELIDRLKEAVKAEKMGVVTEAGPTQAAAELLNETIPGNRVIGVFRPDFAVRMVRANVHAMIEAPIRFYVTEEEDGATLSYKTPSFVFAPYLDEAGEEGAAVAAELDAIFEAIAARAIQ